MFHSCAQTPNDNHVKTGTYGPVFTWLGRRGSNPRMHGPKPCALPLGDAPLLAKVVYHNMTTGVTWIDGGSGNGYYKLYETGIAKHFLV